MDPVTRDMPPDLVPWTTPRLESGDFEHELAAHIQRRMQTASIALGIVVAFMWAGPHLVGFGLNGRFAPFNTFSVLHLVSIVSIGLLIFFLRRPGWPHRRLIWTDAAATLLGIGLTLTLAAIAPHELLPPVFCVLLLLLIVRAVIIPSSGRRTLLLSLAAFPGLVAVFAIRPDLPVDVERLASPGQRQAYAGTYLLLSALAAGIAALASKTSYALRFEAFKARRLGMYDLGEMIGAGTMGEVYRATHALLKRPTALKLLKPELTGKDAIARFEREVQQTCRLTHPNTIAVFDYGHTAEGVFYYAMELLEGANLQEVVDRTGPMPPGRVIHVLTQVCGSLGEAHGLGLIHRDIKPGTDLLTWRTA